jgi:hypothetical protein
MWSDFIKRYATGGMQTGMTSQLCGQYIYLLVQCVHTKLQKNMSFKQYLGYEESEVKGGPSRFVCDE